MSATAATPASVLPGTGTVTAVGAAVVVAPGDPPAAVMAMLTPPARPWGWSTAPVAPAPAVQLDRLAAEVAAAGAVGVAVRVGARWAVAVGAGQVAEVDHVGYRTTHHGPWSGELRDATAISLRPPGTAGGAGPAEPLPAGTRSGGGVVVQVEAVLGVLPDAQEGVRCPCGAFVHPLTFRCRACEVVLPADRRLVVAPPVAVCRLVLDDGRSMALGGAVVVGREPRADPAVAAGAADELALTDSERSVSRVHAALRVDGWDVLLEDREAVNGTAVRPPSAGRWTVLDPGSTVRLLPGTEVQLGRRTVRVGS